MTAGKAAVVIGATLGVGVVGIVLYKLLTTPGGLLGQQVPRTPPGGNALATIAAATPAIANAASSIAHYFGAGGSTANPSTPGADITNVDTGTHDNVVSAITDVGPGTAAPVDSSNTFTGYEFANPGNG